MKELIYVRHIASPLILMRSTHNTYCSTKSFKISHINHCNIVDKLCNALYIVDVQHITQEWGDKMKNTLEFQMTTNNVTVSKLARDIGVTRHTIYRVLNGGTPSAKLMMKLSKYFKKPVNDLFCA
ncbi:helix-turn-helix transcriptional regulator [Cohnella sp. GCM10027633]|uniref:helix-turn-helix transcriptional regulator n=1 Tax=unclassified Cohnella TaxID=2636738 RepID=UPI0036355C44